MSLTFQAIGFAAVRLAGAVLAGLALGWLLGSLFAGVALVFGGYLAWQLVNLFRLDWWVHHRGFAAAPDLGGAWGRAIAQIARLHRRKRFHKQRFLELYRQIQHSTAALPDGVVILDAEREIVWFNRMAGELLKLRRPADLGLRIDNLVRQPEFVRYLAAGQYVNPVVIRHGTGEAMYLALQVVPYGEGQLLLLVRDVSRQMLIEAMRKDFVANASHELRSPLTVICGYLETLSREPALGADLEGPIAEMRRQADRMTAIVRDLLELSRLEAAGAAGGEPIDVGALLADLRRDVLAREAPPREVRVRLDSDAPLVGNPSEIHSAFFNLLDNAAKFTPREGVVEMRWRVDGEGGELSVEDTGIGIPPEHIPRLTERFYRVDPGRSRSTGGSGLGLAIVKHVLQRHDATLEIRSRPGEGSVFICRFPPQRIGHPAGAPVAAVPL
ncbi:MAG: phosphate regulon sensor histidine kinase PhoR [Steroidobacteraceae bacterium]